MDEFLALDIIGGHVHEHGDAPHPFRLLRPCGERPCRRNTADPCDELAPPHGAPGKRFVLVGSLARYEQPA